ncbi:hypothetical protein U8607_18715 [Methylobacterium durans]|uniref:hypothetical protein n=1 Tax=Methylobacterium durans TaxID=2202825 RepID=UPI002AFF2719|nr:hypothetical protein [Methylobacterium durans]MEA1834126.1 hypothetical protein [Methylobacterium durans]
MTRTDRPQPPSRLAPSRSAPSRLSLPRASLFRAGLGLRLALAAACAGGLWGVILWALR